MLEIQENVSLKPYNTFGIDAKARTFVVVNSDEELAEALTAYPTAYILGGGSNILITKDIEVPIIKINTKGISVEKETEDSVWVTAKAGEVWHDFVSFCLEKNFAGVENLSLIYGSVGATLVQNIGAYGAEIKDVMHHCTALEIATKEVHIFTNDDCKFGYRDSIFKQEAKGKFVITSVTFKLAKKNHKLNVNYGDIQKELASENQPITIQSVAKAIVKIRQSKLPPPEKLGNSGSFFKNPVVSSTFFKELQQKFPEMPHYQVSETEVKIPAGYLIDACKLKGFRQKDAGVHQQQALVLVNYGNASGQDILDLAKFIQQKVFETYQISLEMEVNIL